MTASDLYVAIALLTHSELEGVGNTLRLVIPTERLPDVFEELLARIDQADRKTDQSLRLHPEGQSGYPVLLGLRANDRNGWVTDLRGRTCKQLAKPHSLRDVAAMACYFFNIVEDGHKVDTVGADYPDPYIARMQAVRFAADMLKSEPERVWKGAELRIEATDTWGTVLFTLLIAGVDAEALTRHKQLARRDLAAVTLSEQVAVTLRQMAAEYEATADLLDRHRRSPP